MPLNPDFLRHLRPGEAEWDQRNTHLSNSSNTVGKAFDCPDKEYVHGKSDGCGIQNVPCRTVERFPQGREKEKGEGFITPPKRKQVFDSSTDAGICGESHQEKHLLTNGATCRTLSRQVRQKGAETEGKAKKYKELARIQACSTNSAGKFETSFRADSYAAQALSRADYVVLDLETTALTPYSASCRVGKATRLAGTTWHQYRQRYDACTVDGAPRTRVLTAATQEGVWAWDLDCLSDDERHSLILAAVHNQIVIGANLPFDLTWLAHLHSEPQPSRIIDVLLVVKHVRHGAPVVVLQRAGAGNPECRRWIDSRRGGEEISYSLDALTLASGGGKLDKSYQKPQNWAVSHLSDGHYDYCVGDVTEPLRILRWALLLPEAATVAECIEALDERAPLYRSAYEPSMRSLVGSTVRGLPLDLPRLSSEISRRVQHVAVAATALIAAAPAFEACRSKLASTSDGTTTQIKEAWAQTLRAGGYEPPMTSAGALTVSAKALKMTGALSDPVVAPAWEAWESLSQAKKRVGMLDSYRALADKGGRLHPLFTFTPRTARMASSEPNAQNIPSDVRTCVRAREGHVIISADYSQIELRIAAALCLRAVGQIRNSGDQHVRQAANLAMSDDPIPAPSPDEIKRNRLWDDALVWDLARALRDVGWPSPRLRLREAYQEGIDLHLLTALSGPARSHVPTGTDPLDWLRAQSINTRESLKDELSNPRKRAKAQNFGLLYGMSARGLYEYGRVSYGLDWTLGEAEAARTEWFAAYPEIRVWHALTMLSAEWSPSPLYMRGWDGNCETKRRKFWQVETLDGRSMTVLARQDALNYQDQGTGADILCRAIARLRDVGIDQYMIAPVHDELVFEVRSDSAEHIRKIVETVMIAAAEETLAAWAVPAEVESATDETWQH